MVGQVVEYAGYVLVKSATTFGQKSEAALNFPARFPRPLQVNLIELCLALPLACFLVFLTFFMLPTNVFLVPRFSSLLLCVVCAL